ncbi:hypothetical protein SBI_04488 [Streptomyces bingchenggensis BCW-1]|uniref:DUF7691 domain-containing protein n=1 Tax=Streptomyces bingchenggensis (strain BCW-1) TaxID=749414 RepID=D7BVK7_STRBB|nr:hypothetical protein SBI_04488 [Streptomyces bingchenggensis BCW-1]
MITMKTVTLSRTLAYMQGGEFTAQQQQIHDTMREWARGVQRRIDYQQIDWGLTVPEALEHLIMGRADAEGEYVGYAYYAALLAVIECIGSDPVDVGVYSKPSTFFGLMDDELRALGVPADLLPYGFLFADFPDLLPFPVPSPMDGYPAIGYLPLDKAKTVADAYTAVLDRMDHRFSHDAKLLIDKLNVEHEEWQTALKYGHTMDLLVFCIQG